MNSNTYFNEQKIKNLDIQMIATTGFILALVISYFLSYDKKLSLENKKRIFSDKEAQNLALFQTILVFIISACFLYINYKQYLVSKAANDDDVNDILLQIKTSVLAIIAAIVGLYIVIKNYNKNKLEIAETDLF